MKLFNKVRGTMDTVPNIEVNRDTVYIRSNITKVEEGIFKGWEYDEVQYDKDEYTEELQSQINIAKESNDFLGKQVVDKDMQILNLQNENSAMGEQLVQMDIRLIKGGM